MKKRHLALFLLILLLSLYGCAGLEQNRSEAVTLGSERLVLRDAGNGWTAGARWCGNDSILLDGSKIGVLLLDLKSGEKKVIMNTDVEPWSVNCTPDAKWILYTRYTFIPNPSYEEYDGPGENLYQPRIPVNEVYRYDLATGRSDKFADARSDVHYENEWVSPDGKKIFLMPWYNSGKENTVEWLEHVSFTNEWWRPGALAWFPDSSGVAADLDYPYSGLGIEVFAEDGWSKVFTIDEGIAYQNIMISEDKSIYYDTSDAIYRCDLSDKELSCDMVVSHTYGSGAFIWSYNVLSDGDILFQGVQDKCVRRITPGDTKAECAIDTRYEDEKYKAISLGSLSPDGERMIFVRSYYVPTETESFHNYRADLFVIELRSN